MLLEAGMFRAALITLLAAVPAFAGTEEPVSTPPAAMYSAEAEVLAVKRLEADEQSPAWNEVTLRVTRCFAGSCAVHQLVKVQVAVEQWTSAHREKMGVVRYEWKDKRGSARVWTLALRLGDTDQKERFERESETALKNAGAPVDPAAVAER